MFDSRSTVLMSCPDELRACADHTIGESVGAAVGAAVGASRAQAHNHKMIDAAINRALPRCESQTYSAFDSTGRDSQRAARSFFARDSLNAHRAAIELMNYQTRMVIDVPYSRVSIIDRSNDELRMVVRELRDMFGALRYSASRAHLRSMQDDGANPISKRTRAADWHESRAGELMDKCNQYYAARESAPDELVNNSITLDDGRKMRLGRWFTRAFNTYCAPDCDDPKMHTARFNAALSKFRETYAHAIESNDDRAFRVHFRAEPQSFLRLSHYGVDSGSCYRHGGQSGHSPWCLAESSNTIVFIVKDDDGTIVARAWGAIHTRGVAWSNVYSGNGLHDSHAHAIIEHAARDYLSARWWIMPDELESVSCYAPDDELCYDNGDGCAVALPGVRGVHIDVCESSYVSCGRYACDSCGCACDEDEIRTTDWGDSYCDECWCERFAYDEYNEEDISTDDAVQCRGSNNPRLSWLRFEFTTHIDNCTYCERDDEYVLSDEAIALYDGEYAHESNVVELHDGEYAHDDDEDIVELHDGGYAHCDDDGLIQCPDCGKYFIN